jgi:putative transposase
VKTCEGHINLNWNQRRSRSKWSNKPCISAVGRKLVYKWRDVSFTLYTQKKELPAVKKEFPEFKQVYSQVLQDVCQRLDKTFQAFFRRLKNGEKAGFPRFRGQNRYDSFTYPQSGYK